MRPAKFRRARRFNAKWTRIGPVKIRTYYVGPGMPFATIQEAIDAIPRNMSGPSTIMFPSGTGNLVTIQRGFET